MKRRLTEVADFHHAASKALRVPAEGSEGPSASQAGTPGYLTSPELHTELVRWAVVIEPSLLSNDGSTGDTAGAAVCATACQMSFSQPCWIL